MRMNRRNALIGLGAVATGAGAVFGSGAFTSVEAERTADINVANDSDAILSLEPGDGGYVTENGNGVIEFSFEDLNRDAELVFEDVLTVTNDGTETVNLSVNLEGSFADNDEEDLANDIIEVSGGGSIDTNDPTEVGFVFDTHTGDQEPTYQEIEDALDAIDEFVIVAE